VKLRMACFGLLFSLIMGCGGADTTTPGTDVNVTGTVTLSTGPIPAGVSISFQPTGGATLPATFPLKADGSFSGKMKAGKYAYFLSVPEGNAKLNAVLNKLPDTARKASLERQIDVQGGELKLQL
jgi:hypothetical protein